MSRPLLIVAVGLAAYAVVSTLVAAAVACMWPRWRSRAARLAPAARGARLTLLRMAPAGAGAAIGFGLVIPVFVAFEPVRAYEPVGPLLVALASCGALLFVTSLRVAAHTAWMTHCVQRAWLRSATPLDVDPPAGVPAYVIDTLAPVVALVGVFSPRLVAARGVVEACSPEELAAIVAHERGHLAAHDNLKRWAMTCAPDLLRWTPLHRQICDAWRDAAEDAADDLATRGRERARVNLAALLVKVARLAAGSSAPALVSPFADTEGLERRVRRLLTTNSTPAVPARSFGMAARVVVAFAAMSAVVLSGNFERLYDIVEFTIRFGR